MGLRKGILLTGVGAAFVSLCAYAAYEFIYSAPIEISTQSTFNYAAKPKLVRLGNGMLILPYGDAVEDDPSRYTYDAKGDKDRPARDIFVRTCNSKQTDCSVEENWSDAVNISNTALQTSISTDWDGNLDGLNDRKPYYGDSDKPSIFSAGSRVVVSWVDKFCPGGEQRTVTYFIRDSREIPFSCMYESHSNNGGMSWSTPQQLSSGLRDAKSDVSRGNSEGRWVATWQEDPLGLSLGSGEGPGDGASGARVSGGTDIWYSYSNDLTTAADVGVWSTPVRMTDNFDGSMTASGDFDPIKDSDGNLVDDADIEGGKGGAARVNTALVGSTVISAYEERKASGGLDIGKYVRYHQFTFNDVAGTNNPIGCIISNPAENGRRVRFVTQGSPGPQSGLRWAVFWKEGEFTEGGPSDIMLRRGSTDFTPGNLFPAVDANCNAPDFEAAEALNNAPALNLSHETENVGDLTASTGLNPYEDARAHRALLRGDDLYVGWSYTPDWAVARFTTLENYNFWFRHYEAAVDSWGAPVNLSNITDKGINVKEPRLVGTPGSNGPGCPTGDPADPTTTLAEDCKNSSVFYVGWGTETNVPEEIGGAVDLDIHLTRTTDKGDTFEPIQTIAGAAEEEFESQIRPTPAGNMVYVTWGKSGAAGAVAEFTAGALTYLPEADLSATLTLSDTKIKVNRDLSATVAVTNNGPDAANNVLVSTSFQEDLLSVSSADGCAVVGNRVDCTVAALAVGASETFNLVFTAESKGSGSLLTNASSDEIDPDTANNADREYFKVRKGGGGCAYLPGGDVDPILPLIVLGSIAALYLRRRREVQAA
jgi:uncharacterized repeat protein (TIGR01451 family)